LISPRALDDDDDDDDDARTPERLRAKDDDEEGRCCPRSRKRGIDVSVDIFIKTCSKRVKILRHKSQVLMPF